MHTDGCGRICWEGGQQHNAADRRDCKDAEGEQWGGSCRREGIAAARGSTLLREGEMDKTPMKATVARIAAQTAMTRRVKKKLPPPISGAWKVVRGDKVEIVSGKEKGKRGTVLKIYRKEQRVLVEGLNLVKRHTPGQSSKLSGGLVHCVRELSLM